MAEKDKVKWNDRYSNNPIPDTPVDIVTKYAPLAAGSNALDVACGMGRHSKYLAKLGFTVDALDISSLAIDTLKSLNQEKINAQEVDFDSYRLPEEAYDLLLCTFFLQRELFPQMIRALKPGGMLIYETFVYHPDNEQTPTVRNFLLEEGELDKAFKEDFEVIESYEYWHETVKGLKMKKAVFVGRKP